MNPKRQKLEMYIMDDLAAGLGMDYTPGSGNVLGNGDVRHRDKDLNAPFTVGFECKDKNTLSHTVSDKDWKKACAQIKGDVPIFVTRNKDKEILCHLRYEDLKDLLIIVYNER